MFLSSSFRFVLGSDNGRPKVMVGVAQHALNRTRLWTLSGWGSAVLSISVAAVATLSSQAAEETSSR